MKPGTSHPFVAGATAGLVATVPQTVAMLAVRGLLPGRAAGRFPPRQVAEAVLARATGRRPPLSEPTWWAVTAASHFAFGGAAGGLYPLVGTRPGGPVGRGAAYGLLVWAASYLVLLPAVGIVAPAADRPVAKHLQLVAAHLAWGAATAVLFQRFARAGVPVGPDRRLRRLRRQ